MNEGCKNFGVEISYDIQEKPNGIAEALIIGEKFINNDDLILFHWLIIISYKRYRQGMNLHYQYMKIAPYLIAVQKIHLRPLYRIDTPGFKVQLPNKII